MAGSTAVVAHERAFVALLVSDIQAFNESYVEKEEQSVIKLSLLEERLLQAHQEDQRASLYKVSLSCNVKVHLHLLLNLRQAESLSWHGCCTIQ